MKKLFLSILIGLSLFFLGSCSLGDEGTNPTFDPVSLISIYNAVPETSANLNYSFNSVQVNTTPLAYASGTGYVLIEPGTRAFRFNMASGGATVVDTTFNVVGYSSYSFFVVKRPNSTALMPIVVEDSKSRLLVSTNQMVRFVNLSPDSPALDVRIVGADPTNLALGSSYRNVGQFIELSPNSYNIEIRKSSDQSLVATYSLTGISQKFQSVLLTGYFNPPSGNPNTITVRLIN